MSRGASLDGQFVYPRHLQYTKSAAGHPFNFSRLPPSMLFMKIKRGSWIRLTQIFALLLIKCYQCQSQTPALSVETSVVARMSVPDKPAGMRTCLFKFQATLHSCR